MKIPVATDGLCARLARRLSECPEQLAVQIRTTNGAVRWSWADLVAGAAAVANHLRTVGVGAGEPVLILRRTSARLIADYLGALLYGARPCLLAPPNPRMEPMAFARRLEGLLGKFTSDHTEAPWIIADAQVQRHVSFFT